MEIKNKPLIEVMWLDAWSTANDYYPEGDHTGLKSKTVGYLMEYTDTSIVLAMCISKGGEDRGSRVFVIPSAYIVSVEELV